MRHAEPREQAAQDVARLLDAMPGLRAAVDLAATAQAAATAAHRKRSKWPEVEPEPRR